MAALESGSLTSWDLTMQPPRSFRAMSIPADSAELPPTLVYGPAEQIAVSQDRIVSIFQHSDKGISTTSWRPAHEGYSTVVGFSPDGRRLITNAVQDVPRAWDLSVWQEATEPVDLRPAYRLSGHSFDTASSGGRWLLAGGGIFDLDSLNRSGPGSSAFVQRGLPIAYTPDGRMRVPSRALSSDGKWLAEAGTVTQVRKFVGETSSWNPVFEFANPDLARAVAFNPAGTQVAVATSHAIQLRDLNGLSKKGEDRIQQAEAETMAFDPSGRWLVAAGKERTRPVFLFTSDSDTLLAVFFRGRSSLHLYSLASPDLRRVKVWNDVTAAAMAPDGNQLAIAVNGKILLVDPESPEKVETTLVGHLGSVQALAFRSDQPWLASAGSDSTVRLWHLESRVSSHSGLILAENQYGVDWLGFRSTFLFSTGAFANRVSRWDLRLNCLKALACRVAGRSLTRDEWRAATGLDEAPPGSCSKPLPKEIVAECSDVLAPYGG